MANKIFCVLGCYVIYLLAGIVDADRCYYYISTYDYYSSTYCYSCCSFSTYNPCCSNYDYDNDYLSYYRYRTISAGAIAGIVIGSLVGLGVFIAIIVCVCNASRNQRQYGGQVITTTQPTVSYISSSNTASNQPFMHAYGGQVNGGFTMGPAVPIYSKDNNSAPPPSYSAVVDNTSYQPQNSHVQYPLQTSPVDSYTSLTPQSANEHQYNTTYQTGTSEHYYSSLLDSQTPSATNT